MDGIAFIPTTYNHNVFTSVSLDYENTYSTNQVDVLTQFVTEIPRLTQSDMQPYNYAFSYFNDRKIDFSKNQDSLQVVLNGIFGHTQPLGDTEQSVLNKTYLKSLRSTPNRPNRL